VLLYDILLHLAPSPVAQLQRAIALRYTAGPRTALAAIDELDSKAGQLRGEQDPLAQGGRVARDHLDDPHRSQAGHCQGREQQADQVQPPAGEQQYGRADRQVQADDDSVEVGRRLRGRGLAIA
jgi:hypothetical protein